MKRYIFACFLFFLSGLMSITQAGTPAMDDFAFGAPIEIREEGSLYAFSLNEQVYESLLRDDFGDIRIFNQDRKPVPYSLAAQQQKPGSGQPPAPVDFFPIFSETTDGLNALHLNIKTDKSGAIINVNQAELPQEQYIRAYLIDLSALDQMPDALQFEIDAPMDSYTLKTRLAYSDNLSDWHPLKTDAALVSLNFAGHSLQKNKIKLPPFQAKYLRLRWPLTHPFGSQAKIRDVQAIFPDKKTAHQWHWTTLRPASANETGQTLEFFLDGVFPCTRLALDLPGKNMLLQATISSRPDRHSEWKTRGSGLFFKVNTGSTMMESEAVATREVHDAHWQVTVHSPHVDIKSGDTDMGIGLKIGWVPHELRFLNQGPAPFALAFGNWDAGPEEDSVRRLLADFTEDQKQETLRKAQLGPIFPLAGDAARQKPFPWKTYALWGILAAGVTLLAGMAVQVSRQMKA